MQSDDDIGKVAQATPVVVGKALEIFLCKLVEKSCDEARLAGAKKINALHVKNAVDRNEKFDFLVDVVAKYGNTHHSSSHSASSIPTSNSNTSSSNTPTSATHRIGNNSDNILNQNPATVATSPQNSTSPNTLGLNYNNYNNPNALNYNSYNNVNNYDSNEY